MGTWRLAFRILPTALLVIIGWVSLSHPKWISRRIVLVCFTLVACIAFQSSHHLMQNPIARDTHLRAILIFTSHFWYLFGSQRTANATDGHDPTAALLSAPGLPLHRGYKLLFNYRGIGTKWELRNLREDPTCAQRSRYEKRDGYPAMGSLVGEQKGYTLWPVIRIIAILATQIYLLGVWYDFHDPQTHFLVPSDFSSEKEVLIRRLLGIYPSAVTRRELLVRIWAIFENIVPDLLKISILHNVFGIIFMAVGLDDPTEWPPVFGSLAGCFSVRFYWSRFWHRLIYRSFSAHADLALSLIPDRLIRGHGGIITSRLLKNWIVFAFSAIMHGMVDWQLYPNCAFSRSLLWWLIQPVAFLIEGIVSRCWRNWTLRRGIRGSRLCLLMERSVGYVWVFAWMYWSVPKRIYPLITC